MDRDEVKGRILSQVGSRCESGQYRYRHAFALFLLEKRSGTGRSNRPWNTAKRE